MVLVACLTRDWNCCDVLESEPVDVMPGKKASLQWAGTVLALTILMINVTALTRRVCHRRGRSGSAGIGRRVHRCVLMGSQWLSVAMTGQFKQF